MTATKIPEPRTRYARTGRRGVNAEMLSWLFMRFSGAILVILVFGHLFVNLWLGEGVQRIDFAFVSGKWANPFWQTWDLLMLWLGMFHGGNGVRTIINDYARSSTLRLVLKVLLYVAVVVTVVLGTLVIFTFSPCPAGADPSLLPSICSE
ncbi:succinate dehydrogenase hydrophobic membrane anchor subunit [Brachybacterium halotolerans subsp. kimchii]|jgi:succinate dehydrogenase / fumarate reductase, membrane anchor subunit|uniref:Succinate dehydrogenase hydrophobic membrane anchor subunit n=1 Tax=Brachybacterium kimchii TaxID=2942909 RepID=A0ABY4N7B7_9MICO|nr:MULTISPECIES: succinate dehydrogenase hydrophobic membrane anchor subunit [Brachybacterium]UEJ82524.1 succinate dehydrogenase hydrophobic membrane anchor subunit [Brachybacterium halotolerans subsp. kimchii]UQN30009.1 succinate dehydrogenase hydrophobic membrane anchor subunit [Brachybacterium kimchii]